MNTQSVNVKIDNNTHVLKISASDTVQTIIQQIAKKLDISPMFIFLTKKDSLTKVENIKGLPFKSSKRFVEISDLTNAQLEFETLRSIEKEKTFDTAYLITKKYLEGTDAVMATFYYFYNKPTNANFIDNPSSEEFRGKQLEKYMESTELLGKISDYDFIGINGVQSFKNIYEKFYGRVKESIENLNKVSTLTEILEKSKEYNTKDIEKLITETKLTFTNIKCVLSGMEGEKDEYEYFNNAILSNDVPLIYINGFYKVLKGFKVDKSWIEKIKEYSENEKNKNHLVLFVLNKYNYNQNSSKIKDAFSLISVLMNENNMTININSQIEDFNNKTDLKEEQLLTRICNALEIKSSSVNVEIYPQNLRCIFYITKTLFEKIFYYDLLMNNNIVSEFLCANERFRIFNKRGGVQSVFKQCETIFSLQSMLVSRPLRKRIGTSVKVNEFVTEIKVSYAKNLSEVDLLKKYLSLMTSVYNKNIDCLQGMYSKLPNFEKEKRDVLLEGKKEKEVRMTLASYDPELFVAGYPKRCNKSPIIIEDEEDAKEKMAKGENIMKYPLFDEFKTYYYSCKERPNYPYPGLLYKKNLSSWPLPCCFEVDQTTKKNSIRYMYENKQQFDEDETIKALKEKILVTRHTLPSGGIGKLTKNIEDYFRIVDQNNLYIRRYIPQGPRSVLVAIASSLKDKRVEPSDDGEEPDIDSFIDDKIDEMKKLVRKNIGFQNAYNFDRKTIIHYLNEPEKFLDVRFFHTLLEELFKCNIFIFVHNKEYPEGNFASPEFAHNFLTNKQKYSIRPSVILYETTGSNNQNLLYPHYEIIGTIDLTDNKKPKKFMFNKDDKTVQELFQLYENMYFPYGIETRNIIKEIPFTTRILEQQVDFFGKTRIILFQGDVNVLTMPIDSMTNNMLKSPKSTFNYKPCELENAITFMKNEDIKYSQVLIKNILVGLKGVKGNINIYIPVNPQEVSNKNMQIQQLHSISFIRDSELDKYNQYEQISRHLTSHVVYEFSKFLRGRTLSDKTLFKLLEEFYNTCFEIGKTNEIELYKNIPRNFSKPTSFKSNNKIIVSSKELAKRLLYTLFVDCRRSYERIVEYKNLTFVPHYYKNIRDFDSSQDNIIFPNTESIELWIESPSEKLYNIHDKLSDEFVEDINKGYAVLNAKSFFNDKLQGVYICCKENESVDLLKGTLLIINNNIIEKQGSGSTIHLTFMYNDEIYLLRMTKYN
jgi:hypothetical protein